MAITFRADKGQALSYQEMDINLGSFYYSSSLSANRQTLRLHYTGSNLVPVNQGTHAISLIPGITSGVQNRVAYFQDTGSIGDVSGFIIDSTSGNNYVGINVDELNDIPLTYALEVSGSIKASGAVYQTSDERTKENIETIDNGLSKILNSRGVSFDKEGKRQVGVIAQEIKNTIPEVVSEDNNSYLSVNYNGIVGVLIEAIKEQDELIHNLYKRVQDLENKL